ncbi:MAG: primosomal protein N' [Alphaproteobacteria bacterium]|nr:primosomal protein N' [Alphaproteobacteria bacterium]
MPASNSQIKENRTRPEETVAVLLPLAVPGPYDYSVPDGMKVGAGDFVRVPLGRRSAVGVVWGGGSGHVPRERLRPLAQRLPMPPLPDVARRFVDWVAAYTLSPPGMVLRMAMSVPAVFDAAPDRVGYRRAEEGTDAGAVRMTAARRRVLEAAATALPIAELARKAGVTAGVVRALADGGLLRADSLPPPAFPRPDPTLPRAVLSAEQAAAAAALRLAVDEGGFSVTLLEGVTGSGKTEVYFEAVATALEGGRQILVLLPEIALTAQWLDRFTSRFGVRPAQWHSEMSPAARRETWRAVSQGRVRVVLGARSALFLPYPDLGLIVVDEEHEPAFKQEEGVFYHARDMAVARGRLGPHPVILASATPSLETATNVALGRYRRVHLPRRHADAALPEIVAVDMRRHLPEKGPWGQSWLSPPLVEALTATLAAGEQAMLFLNRRGFAPLTLCRVCGHRIRCPDCTAWLVEHRARGRLECHHCGHFLPFPPECPACGAFGSLSPCGPGVERIVAEAAGRFPEARIAQMTSDTLPGPAAVEDLVRRVLGGEIDLLIGTQIMAKGHHFPMLTLVGVVDADLGLSGGDLRAAERTHQLLFQVSGRAGRAGRAGRVLIQTYQPDHPVMAALVSGDQEGFLAAESEQRREMDMPPFGRLAAVIVSGFDAAAVDRTAAALARLAPRGIGYETLGPAPAPLAMLRGRHRRRFLLKASRGQRIQPLLEVWLARVDVPANVRVQVDVDPHSFL